MSALSKIVISVGAPPYDMAAAASADERKCF